MALFTSPCSRHAIIRARMGVLWEWLQVMLNCSNLEIKLRMETSVGAPHSVKLCMRLYVLQG